MTVSVHHHSTTRSTRSGRSNATRLSDRWPLPSVAVPARWSVVRTAPGPIRACQDPLDLIGDGVHPSMTGQRSTLTQTDRLY